MWSDWKAEMLEKLVPILALGGDRNKAAQGPAIKGTPPGRSLPSLRRGYNGRIRSTQPVSFIFSTRTRLHPESAIHCCWKAALCWQPVCAPHTLRTGCASFPFSSEGSADPRSTAFSCCFRCEAAWLEQHRKTRGGSVWLHPAGTGTNEAAVHARSCPRSVGEPHSPRVDANRVNENFSMTVYQLSDINWCIFLCILFWFLVKRWYQSWTTAPPSGRDR